MNVFTQWRVEYYISTSPGSTGVYLPIILMYEVSSILWQSLYLPESQTTDWNTSTLLTTANASFFPS